MEQQADARARALGIKEIAGTHESILFPLHRSLPPPSPRGGRSLIAGSEKTQTRRGNLHAIGCLKTNVNRTEERCGGGGG